MSVLRTFPNSKIVDDFSRNIAMCERMNFSEFFSIFNLFACLFAVFSMKFKAANRIWETRQKRVLFTQEKYNNRNIYTFESHEKQGSQKIIFNFNKTKHT